MKKTYPIAAKFPSPATRSHRPARRAAATSRATAPARAWSIERFEPRTLMSNSALLSTTAAWGGSSFGPLSPTIVAIPLVGPVLSAGPQVPGGLTATPISSSTVQLTWSDSDPTVTAYSVLRSTDGVNFSPVATVGGGYSQSYLDTSLSSNTTYQYEVAAIGAVPALSSDPSDSASAQTLLIAPSTLNAATGAGSSVSLSWTPGDPSSTGYAIYRSCNGGQTFSKLAVAPSNSPSYVDGSVATGTSYVYQVVAQTANNYSAASPQAITTTPLAAPTGLVAAANGGSSVTLSWTAADPNATGYYVLRSTGGAAYSVVGTLSGLASTSFVDTGLSSLTSYSYEIKAVGPVTSSALSAPATVTTTLNAPVSVTAAASSWWVNVSWTNADPSATGYTLLRSTDGTNFSPIATITSAATTSYSDKTVSAGTTYNYEVQATTPGFASAASAASKVVAPTLAGAISVTTRYTNELVITASGSADSIFVSQSGATISIFADGQTFTAAVPAAGVFIYTRGGADSITLASSLTATTTLETIDGAATTISSQAANVTAWVDSADSFSGLGSVHYVSAYAGGTSKAVGAALPNPSDSGTTKVVNQSLFGTGPVAGDVNQGSVGDCYFLSSLAAFAGEKPSVLINSAVDMGDGTYTVQMYQAGVATYYRVSNQFATGGFGGFNFAYPGASGSIWAMVLEKAYAYARSGANTYASLNSGWMSTVYANFGVACTNIFPSNYSSSAFYTMISGALSSGKAITFGTSNAPNLVNSHAYTLVSAYIDANGNAEYVVRNPWGVQGDSLENSQGYATLTFAQVQANFFAGTMAT